jgi:hypothetical protein
LAHIEQRELTAQPTDGAGIVLSEPKVVVCIRRERVRFIALAGNVALQVGLSLAVNTVSVNARWPGVLDVIRRHPWPAISVIGALAMAFVIALDLYTGNHEAKSGADAANQPATSKTSAVTTSFAGSSIRGPIYQSIIVNYGDSTATAGGPDKPAPAAAAAPVPAELGRPGQHRSSRLAWIWPYLAVTLAVSVALPLAALHLSSPLAPKSVVPATSPSPSRQPPTPASSPPRATAASTTPAANPAAAGAVLYHHVVILNQYGQDLDSGSNPPTPAKGETAVVVSMYATGLNVHAPGFKNGMRLATYNGSSSPGAETCIQALNQSGRDYANAIAGQYICLRTAGKNIAVIHLISVNQVGVDGTIKADVTLYRG